MIFVGAQSKDGVIIGGIGDDVDEALQEASRAGLTDDFSIWWSQALTELSDAASTEADALRQDTAAITANSAGDGRVAADRVWTDADIAQAAADEGRPALTKAEEAPADGDSGRTEGTSEVGEEAVEGREGESEEGPRCAVCAESVTEARAELSEEVNGEVRCKKHTS